MEQDALYDRYLKSYETYVKSMKPLNFIEMMNHIPRLFRPILKLLNDDMDYSLLYDDVFACIINSLFIKYGIKDSIEDWEEFGDTMCIDVICEEDLYNDGSFQKFNDDLEELGIKLIFYCNGIRRII